MAHSAEWIGRSPAIDSVLAEQADGVAVISWRPPARVAQMCCATSTQAPMAVTNVYFAPRSQMGARRPLRGQEGR